MTAARPGAPPLAVVFRTHSDIEASIVRGLLEAHGIDAGALVGPDARRLPAEHRRPGRGAHLGPGRAGRRGACASSASRGRGPTRGRWCRLADDTRDLSALEERLGYRFRDPQLLERALTHRSRANEDASGATVDNESLEFLGDAVLGFVMADLLFRDFPQFDEGQKSKIKASLVSTADARRPRPASSVSGEYLRSAAARRRPAAGKKQALLADGYEAVIAAIYLDGGIDAARAFILREFAEQLEDVRSPEFWGRDYKSALQEIVQSRELPLPEYTVAAESGPDHRKIFHVEVRVRGRRRWARRAGASKKAAEQEAARKALEQLGA